MSIIVTNDVVADDDIDIVVVEEVNKSENMMNDCAGHCGQRILSLSVDISEDWAGCLDRMYCLECRSKMLSPPHTK
jgi:hypothetical protein